ncbi:ester cyclase [Streptomyces adustus]|uniref:ester cyclase n=1 Tax=Streptomyces adustus TaxID=1609272 RepID=UPI0035DD98CE
MGMTVKDPAAGLFGVLETGDPGPGRGSDAHSGAFVLFKDGAVDQVVPPTGREIDFEQVHVLDLRDGKVIRHDAVRDDVTMLDQLGGPSVEPAAGIGVLAWRAGGPAGQRPRRRQR